MKNSPQITPKNVLHKISRELELVKPTAEQPFPLAVQAGNAAGAATLPLWATKYFMMEVEGVQSPHTAEAKRRDLGNFMQWYADANGHLAIEEWLPRDTQGFLNSLERHGRAPTTINRAFAVLRRFARWVHEQPDSPFRFGMPTHGIKELAVDEPEAKKLSRREINALFKAADMRVLTDTRKNARPRRNRAILALLYFTGLRVSELCALRRDQYDGTHLHDIRRKGKSRTKRMYVSVDCRRPLDDYLATERPVDDPEGMAALLLIPYQKGDRPLTRQMVFHVLGQLADEASKHKKDRIHIHPHRLRHTFGSEVREETGSDAETARLLGHVDNKYVGIYTRKTEAEREAVLERIGKE
jgi:integrase/recombinase XerC